MELKTKFGILGILAAAGFYFGTQPTHKSKKARAHSVRDRSVAAQPRSTPSEAAKNRFLNSQFTPDVTLFFVNHHLLDFRASFEKKPSRSRLKSRLLSLEKQIASRCSGADCAKAVEIFADLKNHLDAPQNKKAVKLDTALLLKLNEAVAKSELPIVVRWKDEIAKFPSNPGEHKRLWVKVPGFQSASDCKQYGDLIYLNTKNKRILFINSNDLRAPASEVSPVCYYQYHAKKGESMVNFEPENIKKIISKVQK